MLTLIKRSLYILSNKLRRHRQPVEWMREKWTADFSKPEKSCFNIKPEISYNAYLENGSLFIGLKKKNCMAWLETENRVYVDQCIEAHFRFDSRGGYCAAGIMFRIAEQGTYYLALISSKGYFRLDTVSHHIPRTLIGWTEVPDLHNCRANLGIIAKGNHILFLLNGLWIAEVYDTSIPGGHLGFALVSYDSSAAGEYTCQSWLDFLSVDSRARAVESEYQKWNNCGEISAERRFYLAKSLAALDCHDAAYHQILKIWKQREGTDKTRTTRELLFAARMTVQLKQYTTAEEYINTCLTMTNTAEWPSEDREGIPSLYALLGYTCWKLKNYQAAAAAWNTAFDLDNHNGLYAANAANALELQGEHEAALQRRLDGAECFLRIQDYAELGALIPKLQAAFKHFPRHKRLLAFAAALKQSQDQFPPEYGITLKSTSSSVK